jgi:hypothetical protein
MGAAAMSDGDLRARWPAERFYWATIDATPLGRAAAAPTRAQLAFLMEPVLPVPLEQVHCEFVRIGPRRFVGCAADRERLEVLRHDRPDLELLLPEAAPEPIRAALEVAGHADAIERLNLLGGAFEPPAIRGLRRRAGIELVALAALLLLGLIVGVSLRRGAYADAASAADERRRALIVAALGPGDRDGLPPELRLLAELRRLEQRAGAAGAAMAAMPRDASPVLAAVLAAWPEGVDATFESLLVADEAVSLRGLAVDAATAQRISQALSTIDGWRLEQPQFRTSRQRVSFAIDLRRTSGEAAP